MRRSFVIADHRASYWRDVEKVWSLGRRSYSKVELEEKLGFCEIMT